jgi:glycosyltransferase involved in cell wall biosynthesis
MRTPAGIVAAMRVAFVLPTLQPSGGIQVALTHAAALREREGWDTSAVVAEGRPGPIGPAVPVLTGGEAAGREWDVVVWTWWTTADVAMELPARRRVAFVQGLDERFYDWRAPLDRLAAGAALATADAIITVSEHLRDVAAAIRPDLQVLAVPNGLDRTAFAPGVVRGSDGPLRVLVEGQRNLPLKGVDEAIAAVHAMREPVRSTLVALDPAVFHPAGVDRVVGGLDRDGMAALYAESDVVLKLSRAEGLGLPPLEAAAVGTPSVVTPFGGHADWLRHGENGILVGFDDLPGTAAWLDALARDRGLLHRLGAGARETAARWPTVEESADAMAGALRAVAEAEPGDAGAARRAVARSVGRNVELARIDVDRVMRRYAEDHMERLVASKTYRFAEGLRRVWWRLREPARSIGGAVRRRLGRGRR